MTTSCPVIVTQCKSFPLSYVNVSTGRYVRAAPVLILRTVIACALFVRTHRHAATSSAGHPSPSKGKQTQHRRALHSKKNTHTRTHAHTQVYPCNGQTQQYIPANMSDSRLRRQSPRTCNINNPYKKSEFAMRCSVFVHNAHHAANNQSVQNHYHQRATICLMLTSSFHQRPFLCCTRIHRTKHKRQVECCCRGAQKSRKNGGKSNADPVGGGSSSGSITRIVADIRFVGMQPDSVHDV